MNINIKNKAPHYSWAEVEINGFGVTINEDIDKSEFQDVAEMLRKAAEELAPCPFTTALQKIVDDWDEHEDKSALLDVAKCALGLGGA